MKRVPVSVQFGFLCIVSTICVLYFQESHFSGEDPSNFVASIRYGYDIAHDRPHAPGYPGFYVVWKVLEWILSINGSRVTPHEVILLFNSILALFALTLTFFATRKILDSSSALIASALVASNPLFLYFASTSELYVYDAAFSAFLIFTLLVAEGKTRWLLYGIYGFVGCFRLSSFILTLPAVLIFELFRARRSHSLKSLQWVVIAICIGVLSWLVPFVFYLGGPTRFLSAFATASGMPRPTVSQQLSTFFPYMFWMINLSLIPLCIRGKSIRKYLRSEDERVIALVALVLIPGIFFAVRYYAKGYGLLLIAPLAVLIAQSVGQLKRPQVWTISLIGANLLIFLGLPFVAPSARSILAHNLRTTAERTQSSFDRCLSWYAPSHSHLLACDGVAMEADSILHRLRPGDAVFVNADVSLYVHARSLAVSFPEINFLSATAQRGSTFWYHAGTINTLATTSQMPSGMKYFYLMTRAFDQEVGSPISHPSYSTQHLLLFEVSDRNACDRFIDSCFSSAS